MHYNGRFGLRRLDHVTVPAHGDGRIVVLELTLASHLSVGTHRLGEPKGNKLRTGEPGVGLPGRTYSNGPNDIGVGGGWTLGGRRDVLGVRGNVAEGDAVDLAGEAEIGAVAVQAVVQKLSGVEVGRWHRAEGTEDRAVQRVFLADHLVEWNIRDHEVALFLRLYFSGFLLAVAPDATVAGSTGNRKGREDEGLEGRRGYNHGLSC